MCSSNDNQSPLPASASDAKAVPIAAETSALRRDRRKSDAAFASARDRKKDRLHGEHDVGVGYGTSQGYADNEHYADSWAKAPFRIS